MKRNFFAVFICILLLSACNACSTFSAPPTPQTIPQGLVYAQSTATAANELAAQLVTSGAISVDEAKQVGQTTDLVVATVRTARALSDRGDAAGAAAQLAALSADLQMLSEFLSAHRVGGNR